MQRIVQMCLNWRVLSALVAVGAGVWIVAPNLLAGIVPLLLLAVCPLSMLLMMRGMQGDRSESPDAHDRVLERNRAERLARLKRDLSTLHPQEEAISGEIRRLEPGVPGPDGGNGTTTDRAGTSLEGRP